jgi:protein-L-isoaspartate O-methyltransferase
VDNTLGDLHTAVAEELLRRVQSGEAQAADLNVARAFLKDNGIDVTLEHSDPMQDLVKSLPFNVELESA